MPKPPFIVAASIIGLSFSGIAFAQSATPAASNAAPAAAAATAGVQKDAEGKIVLTAGTQVFDTQGGKVGTLTKVDKGPDGKPTNVVLKTGKSEVMIPASSLARTDKNALIAMTEAQIDAAAAAAGASQPAGGAGAQASSPEAASGAADSSSTATAGAGANSNPSN